MDYNFHLDGTQGLKVRSGTNSVISLGNYIGTDGFSVKRLSKPKALPTFPKETRVALHPKGCLSAFG